MRGAVGWQDALTACVHTPFRYVPVPDWHAVVPSVVQRAVQVVDLGQGAHGFGVLQAQPGQHQYIMFSSRVAIKAFRLQGVKGQPMGLLGAEAQEHQRKVSTAMDLKLVCFSMRDGGSFMLLFGCCTTSVEGAATLMAASVGVEGKTRAERGRSSTGRQGLREGDVQLGGKGYPSLVRAPGLAPSMGRHARYSL